MRLPRRQPRAVYVVRDTDDLLSEPESGEPVTREEDRDARGETDQSSGLPTRHVLAGAVLCLTAVFAVLSIVLGLLSLTGGQSRSQRQPASPGAVVSRAKHRLVEVAITKPRGSRLGHGAKRLGHMAISPLTGVLPDPDQRLILSADGQSRPGASITFTPVAAVDAAASEFGFER